MAKRLRAVLEAALADELGAVLQKMPVIRKQLAGDFAAKVKALDTVTAGLAGGGRLRGPCHPALAGAGRGRGAGRRGPGPLGPPINQSCG